MEILEMLTKLLDKPGVVFSELKTQEQNTIVFMARKHGHDVKIQFKFTPELSEAEDNEALVHLRCVINVVFLQGETVIPANYKSVTYPTATGKKLMELYKIIHQKSNNWT